MATHDDLDDVWNLIEKANIGMLTTRHGADLHARPMGVKARRDEGVIYLLTDVNTHKDDAIRSDPHINFAIHEGAKYLSLAGTAEVSNDRAKIRDIWSPAAQAWWDGPDDPNVRLLTLRPHEAHYWKTPGKILSTIAMLAMASGEVAGADLGKPDLGEEKRVRM